MGQPCTSTTLYNYCPDLPGLRHLPHFTTSACHTEQGTSNDWSCGPVSNSNKAIRVGDNSSERRTKPPSGTADQSGVVDLHAVTSRLRQKTSTRPLPRDSLSTAEASTRLLRHAGVVGWLVVVCVPWRTLPPSEILHLRNCVLCRTHACCSCRRKSCGRNRGL